MSGGKPDHVVDTSQTKLFVGGLAWETKTETLRQHFEKYGDIAEAVIIFEKFSGRSKGYGFVTFKEAEAANKACEDPAPVIDGRRANCNLASLRSRQSRPSPRHTSNGSHQSTSSPQGNLGPWLYSHTPYNLPRHNPAAFYGPCPPASMVNYVYPQKPGFAGGPYLYRGQPVMRENVYMPVGPLYQFCQPQVFGSPAHPTLAVPGPTPTRNNHRFVASATGTPSVPCAVGLAVE